VLPFYKEFSLIHPIRDHSNNKHNMDITVALIDSTSDEAKIGVFWAGLIPYYTGRYSIDFLGKADPYIANTYPNLSNNKTVWFVPNTLPGHNKYDLGYTIKKLRPTYIQRDFNGKQNLRFYTVDHYVRFEYFEVNGSITLMLEKESPYVYWEKGKIIPIVYLAPNQ